MSTASDPLVTGRQPVIVGNDILSVSVSDDVARAILGVVAATHEQLTEALAPFGLQANDILVPAFRRVVYRDELVGAGEKETS